MSVRLICVFKCLWQKHDVCESQNRKIKIIKHVKHSRLYYCASNWLSVFSSSLTWSSIFFPFLSFLSSFFPPIHHHSLSFLLFLLIPPTPFPRSPPPPCVSSNITLRSLAPLPPELSSLPFHLHLFLVPLWLLAGQTSCHTFCHRSVRSHLHTRVPAPTELPILQRRKLCNGLTTCPTGSPRVQCWFLIFQFCVCCKIRQNAALNFSFVIGTESSWKIKHNLNIKSNKTTSCDSASFQ